MSAIEGSRELKALAESSHDFVKTYMNKKNTPEPPALFFTAQGILIPDPRNLEDMIRITKRFLEMTGIPYAHCFIARLRDEDGNVVHEDALMAISSDGRDLTYHVSLPFTIEQKEEQVVGILWDEDSKRSGFQSRSENIAHMQTLSPRHQRMLDYIKIESNMANKPLDLLRVLGMRVIPYPTENAECD